MATAKTATKKTSKPAPKPVKKVTVDDVWATMRELQELQKETQRIVSGLGASREETEKARRESEEARRETEKARRESEEVRRETEKARRESEKARRESEKDFRELRQAHKETEKAMKETQRIVGDLGNKFGDEAEYTMIPGLPEKFRQFGFDFGVMSRNRKINNDKYNIHAEIDAFLENNTQAMAVEVKAKLQIADVDYHIKRMEKLRKYADIFGDKRELYGALAATVVQDDPRDYALKNGFYVIEPSGEDVKIIKPDSAPRVW